MNKKMFLQRPKKYQGSLKLLERNEAVQFVREQFVELVKKNLRVPVQLYHL